MRPEFGVESLDFVDNRLPVISVETVQGVRGRNDRSDPIPETDLTHLERLLEVVGPIIQTRKNVVMEINHLIHRLFSQGD
jgi:hypothetical protein